MATTKKLVASQTSTTAGKNFSVPGSKKDSKVTSVSSPKVRTSKFAYVIAIIAIFTQILLILISCFEESMFVQISSAICCFVVILSVSIIYSRNKKMAISLKKAFEQLNMQQNQAIQDQKKHKKDIDSIQKTFQNKYAKLKRELYMNQFRIPK